MIEQRELKTVLSLEERAAELLRQAAAMREQITRRMQDEEPVERGRLLAFMKVIKRRVVAWKAEFIREMGEAAARAILAKTKQRKTHKLVICDGEDL